MDVGDSGETQLGGPRMRAQTLRMPWNIKKGGILKVDIIKKMPSDMKQSFLGRLLEQLKQNPRGVKLFAENVEKKKREVLKKLGMLSCKLRFETNARLCKLNEKFIH